MAALAIAFCRSIDVVDALSLRFDADEASSLKRMSRLANTRVEPGRPTRLRRAIKRLLEDEA